MGRTGPIYMYVCIFLFFDWSLWNMKVNRLCLLFWQEYIRDLEKEEEEQKKIQKVGRFNYYGYIVL